MADFDINAHLQQMGFGQNKQDSGSDGTNEKSTIDAALEAGGKNTYTAAKLVGVPVNLSELGQHGLQKAFGGDTEGLAGKTIMPGIIPNAPGGFLAKLLHDIFVKNREVADHTTGVGGSGEGSGDFGGGASSGDFGGGGGDFSGGGGDFSGNGFSDNSFISTMSFGDLSGAGSFDWSPVSMASLGDLPRPITPDAGTGSGMEIG